MHVSVAFVAYINLVFKSARWGEVRWILNVGNVGVTKVAHT